ncbi:multiubiquitin domain-containing protein [Pseudomonas sp. SST3]|jgi:hypothetical protein|uniref:multiubiquitin domain-containing protein n=1 Tax=Pseudomonas sp. SST3 TaxID=2267882 RepID=UPI0014448357|nr:multiubiquitin domain-containing protein [Pseudomonas sp. SST3]NKQ12664.1 hypothetical protein [Pseudomonas sp. SST3]
MPQDHQENPGNGNDQQPKAKHIIVNARPKEFEGDRISYAQVVQLALPGEVSADIVYTVTYVGPHLPDGTLVEGQDVEVFNGTKFDVAKTNRS